VAIESDFPKDSVRISKKARREPGFRFAELETAYFCCGVEAGLLSPWFCCGVDCGLTAGVTGAVAGFWVSFEELVIG
jgi:hypothetical protein